MDILYISVCFIALFISSSFGDTDPLEVKFENATRVDAMEGAEMIHFRCHLNRGAMYVILNKVEMIHVDPLTSEETIISSAANLVEGKPQFYDVKISQDNTDSNAMIVDFTVLEVRFDDDGKFMCKVSPGDKSDSTENGFDEREVVVHRPLSSLKLKMGDFDSIEESPNDPLRIDPGEYKVTCVAEGSNPATEDVDLTFHGLEFGSGQPVVSAMEGPERKFRTVVNGSLNIMVSNNQQELLCQAQDSTGTSKSVKLTVEVNIYEPVVFCNDTEAYQGEKNPILYCTVNHTGLEVEGFSYQIGDTGDIVKEGEKNEKNIVVLVSNVQPGISVVSLDLHEAHPHYLDKNFYVLVYLKGGHTSKASVRLNRIEGNNNDPNSGVRISSSALFFVMMFVASFWWL